MPQLYFVSDLKTITGGYKSNSVKLSLEAEQVKGEILTEKLYFQIHYFANNKYKQAYTS
jgi:hypothetical protein